jgi:hypothetical protein
VLGGAFADKRQWCIFVISTAPPRDIPTLSHPEMASLSDLVLAYLPIAAIGMKIPLSKPSTVLSALLSYLAAIYGTSAVMRHRAPLKLTRLVQLHNLFLSAVSLVLLMLILDEILPLWRRVGVLDAMCGNGSWTKVIQIPGCAFTGRIAEKILELGVVLQNQLRVEIC